MSKKIKEYETTPDNHVRYILGSYNDNPLYIFGINPSTATKEKNDNTITVVEKIAEKMEYDGYIMFNIYPVRQTSINGSFPTEYNKEIVEKNVAVIESKINENDILVAAWGGHILDREFFVDALAEINRVVNKKGARWMCLSKTKQGHPHHPTRLSYNNMKLEPFDVDSYIEKLMQTRRYKRYRQSLV